MKIILSGGGSGEQTEEIDNLFASLLDKSKSLIYIPIAIDKFRHSYPECLKFIKSTFEKLGIKKYELISEKELGTLSEKELSNVGGIYIGGGNTAYLMKTLKESTAWNFLKKAAKSDIPIYGGSAGAIILAKTILPSMPSDGNFVGLEDLSGMNLLNGKDIWCHYKEENEEKILQFIEKNNLQDVILLSESTGLFINENQIKVMGKIPAKRIKNKLITVIKSQDKIN